MDSADEFGSWPKQTEVMTEVLISSYTGVEEIFLIGPIGSTKTFAMAMTHINAANQYTNCIIPVGRKDLSEAQIGTWEVYMEALQKMSYVLGKHYTIRQAPNDLRIRFTATGSIIQFIGMNKSRDRDWSKLKITATMAGVDEVDDVDEDGYDTLFSRTGRRNDQGAPRVMLSACNPNDKWTKQKIYLPWLKRNNDRRPGISDEEWNAINPLPDTKVVIEFTMEDSPLYLRGYYDRFIERPRNWRERYLYNNWNYIDDENSLFKLRSMDTLTISRLKPAQKYIGVDPNAGGKDRAAICLWEGDTIVDAEVYTTEDLRKKADPDELNPLNTGAILGRLTIDMMEREGVGAYYTAGDINGAGQGWYTHMLSKGYKVHGFISGSSPYIPEEEIISAQQQGLPPPRRPYQMLRDQVFHMWSLDIDNSRVYFYSEMPHLSALKKELQLHEADTTAKVMRVTPKDDIKKLLGRSPDIADSAMMGYWVRMITTPDQEAGNQKALSGSSINEMLYNERR